MHTLQEHVEVAVVNDSRQFVEYTASQVHDIVHNHTRNGEKCTHKQAVKELIENGKPDGQ